MADKITPEEFHAQMGDFRLMDLGSLLFVAIYNEKMQKVRGKNSV